MQTPSQESLNLRQSPFRSAETPELLSSQEKRLLIDAILAKNPWLAQALVQLSSLCNNEDLLAGTWVYEGYKFSWKNEIYRSQGVDFDTTSSVELFSSREFLEYILDKGLENDAVPVVQESLHGLLSHLVSDIHIDDHSMEHLKIAYEQALKEGKKIILLSNHSSHLDGPIIDYIFTQRLNLLDKKLRFLSWAYMFYNKQVRPFIIGSNTTFVYGPSDFGQIVRTILRTHWKKGMVLLQKFQDAVQSSISWNPEEVMLIFPYAGRSGEVHGCKKKIPFWMKESLSFSNCLYVPVGLWNIWKIFPQQGGWWELLRNLADSSPQTVNVVIWQSFCGGESDLWGIHNHMLEVSQRANNL